MCNKACSFADASASCQNGSCLLGQCNANFADCDLNPANGCETPLNTLSNCGGCGVACSNPNGSTVCAAGLALRAELRRGVRELRLEPEQRLRDQHHDCRELRRLRRPVRLHQRERDVLERGVHLRRLQLGLRELRRRPHQRLRGEHEHVEPALRRLQLALRGGQDLRERDVHRRVPAGPRRLRQQRGERVRDEHNGRRQQLRRLRQHMHGVAVLLGQRVRRVRGGAQRLRQGGRERVRDEHVDERWNVDDVSLSSATCN
jgi:hypothetical protein